MKPFDDQIQHEIDVATDHGAEVDGTTISYEQGVRDALLWVLGRRSAPSVTADYVD